MTDTPTEVTWDKAWNALVYIATCWAVALLLGVATVMLWLRVGEEWRERRTEAVPIGYQVMGKRPLPAFDPIRTWSRPEYDAKVKWYEGLKHPTEKDRECLRDPHCHMFFGIADQTKALTSS